MDERDELAILFEVASIDYFIVKEHLKKVLNIEANLIQLIKDEINPPVKNGKAYLETLAIKILFAAHSILDLSEGKELNLLNKKLSIVDLSSIYILTRSIIESFLTIEYLFSNQIPKPEKKFRFKLWKISGFLMRQQGVQNPSQENKEKLRKERVEIERLKNEIKNSELYSSLKKNQIWKLDKYGLPRTLSWMELLSQSSISNKLLCGYYKLYSNYAHSEFVSIMQLNESILNIDDPKCKKSVTLSLNNVRIINCVLIHFILGQFKESIKIYNRFDESTKYIIDVFNKVVTKKK